MNKESFSNQEDLEIKKQRTLSDAELIKGGAEYVRDKNAEEPRLEVTQEQVDTAKKEMEIDIKTRIKEMIDKFGKEKVGQALKEYESEELEAATPVEELIEQDIKEIGIGEPVAERIEQEERVDERLIIPEKLRPIITEVQTGDKNAKEDLLNLFEKYILSVMHDYFGEAQPEDQEDLIQEGKIGLLMAADKCDLDRIDTFKAYAREYIWSYMYRFYSKDQLIQVKEGMKQKIRDLNELENQVILEGEKLAEHEIARKLGVSEQELKRIKEARNLLGIISLDDLHFARHRFGDQEDETNEPWLAVKDKIASGQPEDQPQEAAFEEIFYERIDELLQHLTPKQLFVIDKRFGESWTLERLAKSLNTTRDEARQIEIKALKRLRSRASQDIQGIETLLE